ncbi:hypothetical protein BGW80DRAFT_1443971 [Lactifluus volemus]|nr:hypothetical protein BGW80DRAFT_1443971 [Lactifluus volemus]
MQFMLQLGTKIQMKVWWKQREQWVRWVKREQGCGGVVLIHDHDAKVNELDGAQRTPLQYASGEGGAEPTDRQPLHRMAYAGGTLQSADLLLKHGADLHTQLDAFPGSISGGSVPNVRFQRSIRSV